MEEARRFLRYVLPGLLPVAELTTAALAFGPKEEAKAVAKAILAADGLGAALGLLLASGALGYFFSILYHFLYWFVLWWAAVDHRAVVERKGGKRMANRRWRWLCQKRWDWAYMSAWWWSHKLDGSALEAARPRVDSLADLTHGLGATLVGTTCAYGVWLSLQSEFALLPNVLWWALILIQTVNWRQTHWFFQETVNRSVDGYDEQQKKKSTP